LVSSRVAIVTSATALLIVLAVAAPAAAIFNGGPDGTDHPEVGALLAAQAFSDGTWAFCTGTLVAPDVVLTAAHCQADIDGDRVAVTFDSAFNSSTGTTHWGTFHPDPRFRPAQSNPYDLAVVVLDDPVNGVSPAELPEAGSLANLGSGTKFTSVGYGGQFFTYKKGGRVLHFTDTRYVAVGSLRTESRTWLRVSQNASLGNGGTCNGDSGGPNFLGAGSGETNILAATTITGDLACVSTNVDYRLDTASARWFLGQYVDLP
jgi:secreted trypsin-like serine protease